MRQGLWSCGFARDNGHTVLWLVNPERGGRVTYFLIRDGPSFGFERGNGNSPRRFLIVPDEL